MKAVILAGGRGSRLMPLTAVTPKPLVPIAGKPCIYHIIDLLHRHGIRDIIATIRHGGDEIRTACGGDGIAFLEEPEPLGTAGGVKSCEGLVEGDFIVISGDAVTDIDLGAVFAFHRSRGGIATVVTSEADKPFEFGVCITDSEGRIKEFTEKPGWDRAYTRTVNTGIYVFSREIFDYIEEGREQDFAKDIFPKILKKNGKIFAYNAPGYWCDIGSVKSYLGCNFDVLGGKVGVELPENNTPDGAVIHQPCRIGKNVTADGAEIGPYTVIGDGCNLKKGCRVEYSVLQDNITVGENTAMRNTVICDGAELRENVSMGDYSVLGECCIIGKNSVIGAGVCIAPENRIPDNVTLTSSVRGEYKPYVFEKSSCETIADISVFSRMGGAFGCIFRGNVAVGYEDKSSSAQVHALIGGVLSTGDSVLNTGCCSRAEFRYTLRAYSLAGGIFVTSEKIYMYEGDGLPLCTSSERAFKRVFGENEFICSESGKYRLLKNYGDVYEKKLRRSVVAMKPLNMRIYGDDVLTSVIPVKPTETAERMFVGDLLGVGDYPDRIVKCCVCIAIGKTFGTVFIPYGYPLVIDELAKEYGFTVVRLTLDSPDRSRLYDITDPNVCACVLCGWLSRNRMTFADLAAGVPEFDILSRDVDCFEDKFSVIKRLCEEDGDKELVQGIRFKDGENRWNVRVLPKDDLRGFRIIAEAYNSETAEEMCDFYVKKIKSDKKFVDKRE